jgi:hypothetical protein
MAETIRARMREMSGAVHVPDLPRIPDLPKFDMSAIADMLAKLRHAG